MNIRLLPSGIPNLLPMTGRSADGLHISTVINDICLKLGHYKPSQSPSSGPDMTRLQFGCAWERALAIGYELQYPGRYTGLGELHCDGLYGTPDLFDTWTGAVEEIKLTWSSCRTAADIATDTKFWRYWVQLGAYCWMIRTELSRLHIGFVNGEYENVRVGDPRYMVWERIYTHRELTDNWTMLLSHADSHYERLMAVQQGRNVD